MKRIAVIGDISGFGRCSLSASIPVISYLGVECCPFPTAVLSAQTGYSSYHFIDLTNEFTSYKREWQKIGYKFDGILTGYIASEAQCDLIEDFIRDFKTENTVLLVDPVMGDDGKIYGTYTPSLCEKVKKIAEKADIITPNLSELCLLTGENFDSITSNENSENYIEIISEKAKKLLSKTLNSVIVTGVRHKGKIYNILCQEDGIFTAKSPIFGGSYSGTGDLFASTVIAKSVLGISLESAISSATKFLEKSIESTYKEGTDRNDGVNFQQFLEELRK